MPIRLKLIVVGAALVACIVAAAIPLAPGLIQRHDDLAAGGQTLAMFTLFLAPFVVPASLYLYGRLTRYGPLNLLQAALWGLAVGAGVPLMLFVLAGLALSINVTPREAVGLFSYIMLGMAVLGFFLGPVIALLFGAILRIIDPRYRKSVL